MSAVPTITPAIARRLAICRQRLAGPRLHANAGGMHSVVRDLGCLQLDPISAVARSHRLVLWSRLGNFDPAVWERLMWQERRFFEYWAHAASIVLTEDYPIHSHMMRHYGTDESDGDERLRQWVKENRALQNLILARLRRDGPLLSRDFHEKTAAPWTSTGWTSGGNVNQMLDYLWTKGIVMVAGRSGGQKVWDLSERCLPNWTPRQTLPPGEVVRAAAQKSLRALGVATARQINEHFIRKRYPGLRNTLSELEAEGRIMRVEIRQGGAAWADDWYVHADDLPLLHRLASGEWEPRTTLLSPFDNLICDRSRTETLFDFGFRIEIYTPVESRRFGYYVLPILHGDRLIGRIDPKMDRKTGRLVINSVHAEARLPEAKSIGPAQALATSVEELAAFLGAKEIAYGKRMPKAWRPALRA